MLLGSTLPQVTDRGLTINGPASPGITIDGGGQVQVMQVASSATLNLQNLTIAHGLGLNGSGIFNEGGTLSVINSTFSTNIATGGTGQGNGGGILNNGTLTVTNSTFFNNSAIGTGQGGGIANDGTLSVTNSTFVGNSANGEIGQGGGIHNSSFGATLRVTNSTFFNNSANFGGGGIANLSTAHFKGTILAASSGGNCSGSITDRGYNLSDDNSCSFSVAGSHNNVTNLNLDPNGLQNNGGPTQTVALEASSAAIDQIPLSNCTDQASRPKRLVTDQRGALRPDAGELLCDIGAYEVQDLAGQPLCGVKSVSALIRQFGSIKAAVSALGFPNVTALLKAIAVSCGG